ncbi:hypothetical protein ElyMa_003148900 [Elysia marginata]|uniref:Uncharacterized protein n=1 Tax=Elysia marginata TaxID=1093978 RepID=A0AAV4IZ96_9GAST|nr:hypothetical protein ElyMa_003148900 [Elysia marginata]
MLLPDWLLSYEDKRKGDGAKVLASLALMPTLAAQPFCSKPILTLIPVTPLTVTPVTPLTLTPVTPLTLTPEVEVEGEGEGHTFCNISKHPFQEKDKKKSLLSVTFPNILSK